MVKTYINLLDLDAYKHPRELSALAWKIYDAFDWTIKKIIGDQFIESVDSVGANIAEGFGRFHYLDKVKFYYNARGSLSEAQHWAELLKERNYITKTVYDRFSLLSGDATLLLNGLIRSTMRNKQSTLRS